MAVRKRFTRTVGEREAVVLAEVGVIRFSFSLLVDDVLIEEKSGLTIALDRSTRLNGDGVSVTIRYHDGDLTAIW